MSERNPMNPEQYKESFEAAQASFKSLSDPDVIPDSDLLIGPTYGSAHAGAITDFSSTSQPRVNFTGATTRNRGVNEQEETKTRIAACREAYENAGLVANAVDLMADFALEGLSIVHENKTVQRFMWNWARKVKLGEVCEHIMKAYFVDGNVPVLTFRGRIDSGEVRRLRQATAKHDIALGQKFFTSTDPKRRRILPYKYDVLDVLKFHMEGAELLGNEAFEYELSIEDKRRLGDPSEQAGDVLQKLRKAIGDDEFESLAASGRLRIDPSRIDLIQYKKDGYKQWATPFLWRVIDDLKFKKLLRDMDISVSESVINTLTIIAIGDTPGGFPATPEMFMRLGKLLKTQSKSQTLVWNDLIKIIAEYPPIEKILGKEKYEQVDNDVRSALGISEVILNGSGKGNFANSFLSIKTLIERLESARNQLLRWLEKQMILVAQAMDFRKPAIVRLNHMSLNDQDAEKKLLLDLADRGMISYKNIIERFGENYDIEIQRMKEEDNFRRKNENKFPYVLIKTGKFGPSLANGPTPFLGLVDSETLDGRQTEDAELKRKQNQMAVDQAELTMKQQKENPPLPKLPTQQGSQPNSGGRPSDTKKPQVKKGTPRNKPTGQNNKGTKKTAASINESHYQVGLVIFDKLYKAFCSAIVKSEGLKDSTSISSEKRTAIIDSIANIIGEFEDQKTVTKENVEYLLEASRHQSVNSSNLDSAPPKLNTNIKRVYETLISKIDNVTLSDTRQIIATAFAASRL